jgi:hypothetical protein
MTRSQEAKSWRALATLAKAWPCVAVVGAGVGGRGSVPPLWDSISTGGCAPVLLPLSLTGFERSFLLACRSGRVGSGRVRSTADADAFRWPPIRVLLTPRQTIQQHGQTIQQHGGGLETTHNPSGKTVRFASYSARHKTSWPMMMMLMFASVRVALLDWIQMVLGRLGWHAVRLRS